MRALVERVSSALRNHDLAHPHHEPEWQLHAGPGLNCDGVKINAGQYEGESMGMFEFRTVYDWVANTARPTDKFVDGAGGGGGDEDEDEEEDGEINFGSPSQEPEEGGEEGGDEAAAGEEVITKGDDGLFRNAEGTIVDEEGFALRPEEIEEAKRAVAVERGEVVEDAGGDGAAAAGGDEEDEENAFQAKLKVKIRTLDEINASKRSSTPLKALSFAAPGAKARPLSFAPPSSGGLGLAPPAAKPRPLSFAPPASGGAAKESAPAKPAAPVAAPQEVVKEKVAAASAPPVAKPEQPGKIAKAALALMEAGDLDAAYRGVSRALELLAAQGAKASPQVVRFCASYRMVLRLLILMQKLEAAEATPANKVQSALLARFCSELPMNKTHRLVTFRKAIVKNMAVGNYGVAGRMLERLIRAAPPEDAAKWKLAARLARCEKGEFADKALGDAFVCPVCGTGGSSGAGTCVNCHRAILWDAARLELISTRDHGQCDKCDTVFAASMVGQACIICALPSSRIVAVGRKEEE